MKEWGISKNEFDDTPDAFIEKVFEMEDAVADGRERKENKKKAEELFSKNKVK